MFGFERFNGMQNAIGFGLVKLSDSNIEPVSLVDAKAHLRVDFDSDDDLITALISTVRLRAEQQTGLALTEQTWKLSLDRFPARGDDNAIRLPRGPVTGITSIEYAGVFGDLEVLDPSLYETALSSVPARLAPVFGNRWPSTRPGIAKVDIVFTAGYDAPSLPATLRQAMLLILSSFYDQRSDVVIDGGNVQAIPRGADFLLDMHRISRVGFDLA